MAKIQILKVTKELKEKGIDVSNKEIVGFLKENGVEVSNHFSSISEEELSLIYGKFGGGKDDKKAPAKEESAPQKEVSAPKKEESAPKKEESVPKKEESVPKKEETTPKKEAVKKEESGKPAKSEPAKSAKPAQGAQNAQGAQSAPPKKKHIIFATNNRNTTGGNRFNQGTRQVYRISGGKIEDPEKAVKRPLSIQRSQVRMHLKA